MSGELARAVREEIEWAMESHSPFYSPDQWWWVLPLEVLSSHLYTVKSDERVPIPQRGKG